MKIVFLGTPDFSVPCLQALAKREQVLAVLTQPDKPKGRGYRMIPTPVKTAAQTLGIPVYQPNSLRKGEEAEEAFSLLQQLQPDLIVVVAYGQILPKQILELPPYGCINIHASLLPRWRGAAPIQRCILAGDTVTGVTSMQMAEGLDTGDMLVKASLEIGENETASELHDRLAALGAEVLLETVGRLEDGTLTAEPQNDEDSCYAAMLTRSLSALNFQKSAAELHNVIRGVTGYGFLEGKRMKIYRSQCTAEHSDAPAGTVVDSKRFLVACGDGCCLELREVQLDGGKRLRVEDFLRGFRLEKGMRFSAEPEQA